MKRFIIVSFVIGLTISYLNCSGDNSKTTDCKQLFTGTSIYKSNINPGVVTLLDDGRTLITGQKAEWYDSTDVGLVTGKSIWTVNLLKEPDGNAQLWGPAEILVDEGRGKWELKWIAKIIPSDTSAFIEMQSPFKVECDAVGKGVEGEVMGMEAKWTYTMDFDGNPSTFLYKSEGYIIKK